MNQELLLIAIYCMVDDFCLQPQIVLLLQRSGRKPKLSDAALLSLALLQEFSGITDEDDYWQYVTSRFASYFPGQLTDRSQYHRRRKNLSELVNLFRRSLLPCLPTTNGYHVIDCVGTTAMTLTKFFTSRSFPNASVGYCASKQVKYAGYKTTPLVSFSGVIEDFVVGEAAPHDSLYGEALLLQQPVGTYLGDMGFMLKAANQAALLAKGVNLVTRKHKSLPDSLSRTAKRLLRQFRYMVETVIGQLTELFHYNRPGGKSERGLLSRLMYKLAAHTTGQVILQQLKLPITNLDYLTGVR